MKRARSNTKVTDRSTDMQTENPPRARKHAKAALTNDSNNDDSELDEGILKSQNFFAYARNTVKQQSKSDEYASTFQAFVEEKKKKLETYIERQDTAHRQRIGGLEQSAELMFASLQQSGMKALETDVEGQVNGDSLLEPNLRQRSASALEAAKDIQHIYERVQMECEQAPKMPAGDGDHDIKLEIRSLQAILDNGMEASLEQVRDQLLVERRRALELEKGEEGGEESKESKTWKKFAGRAVRDPNQSWQHSARMMKKGVEKLAKYVMAADH